MKSRTKVFFSLILTSLIWFLPSAIVMAHGISEADKQAMIDGGNLQYIWLGAVHMLTGYDHLLFLFGVIFFLTGFRDIIKFITAFTIGHSITLLFATIWGITANYFLVDAVIAISVIYKGFENLDGFKKYLGVQAPNLLWVVFGFGLIHGFGLSTRLQQLPLGKEGFIMRILSFNLGVELGQIAALFVMLLIIINWRKTESFSKFSAAANTGLVIAGVLLFFMQMHGYLHTSHAHDFTPGKEHQHQKTKPEHSHKHQDGSHSHGGKKHSLQQPSTHSHKHDGTSHSHDNKVAPKKRKSPIQDKKQKVPKHKSHPHDHGDKHDHDHGHKHDGKPHSHGKKVAPKKRKTHSHKHGGTTHSHDH